LKAYSLRKKVLRLGLALLLVFLMSRYIVPAPTFDKPTSTILESVDGTLMSARIAEDGQWRFPAMDSIPPRFEQSLLLFEDRHFYKHPGINPVSIVRALRKNFAAGRVVQGGSTLSMQVARLHGEGQARTVLNKLWESINAVHMEINYSKKEILCMYSSNAPFGGNVVGMETAAWRYFGRSPWTLSWAESATLAVLPNAPSLIYPGKGQEKLLSKRNRLLAELLKEGFIGKEEFDLAVLEPLPQRPLPLPEHAMHLMDHHSLTNKGERIRTKVDDKLQRQADRLINEHVANLSAIEVYNGALIIMDTRSQEILAYVGNATAMGNHSNAVNCVTAKRSTGSILKPLLYAQMIEAGELTPPMLIPDIPSHFSDYSPENYFGDYDGSVHAEEALYRSLNIPFVRLLQRYGIGRFHRDLHAHGLTTINRPAAHYGLSLMLGGAEIRLDEITTAYARMGARLLDPAMEHPLNRWAIHHTFKGLKRLNRPEGREYQRSFNSSRSIAWKTGTSFGHKDAWAIGVTPDYTIGVWAGNADGEGRSGLTGVGSAAPLLFDALDLLPSGEWFPSPMEGGTLVELCTESGYLAGPYCAQIDTLELAAKDYTGLGRCPYHYSLFLTEDEKHQGRIGCAAGEVLHEQSWFILPPLQAHYYHRKHSDYRATPPMLSSCERQTERMQFEYPTQGQGVFIPREWDGQKGRIVCKLAHQEDEMTVHWYLDADYIGSSTGIHEQALLCSPGEHELLVVDTEGEENSMRFEVIGE